MQRLPAWRGGRGGAAGGAFANSRRPNGTQRFGGDTCRCRQYGVDERVRNYILQRGVHHQWRIAMKQLALIDGATSR